MASVYKSVGDPGSTQWIQVAAGETEIEYFGPQLRAMNGLIWSSQGVTGPDQCKITQAADPIANPWTIAIGWGGAVVNESGGQARRYVTRVPDMEVNCSTLNTAPTAARTHSVWVAVFDTTGRHGAEIVVTEDTGSGAPNPSGAAGYVKLGTLTIKPGQTSIANADIVNLPETAQLGYDVAPQATTMLSEPAFVKDFAWHDFPTANWKSMTFSVPASRLVLATISADMRSPNPNQNMFISYRFSTPPTTPEGIAFIDERANLHHSSILWQTHTRRMMWLFPPGTTTVTAYPRYRTPASGTEPQPWVAYAQLIIEPAG